jgi:hypothetical protein
VAQKIAGGSKAKATTTTVEKPFGNEIAYSPAVNTATPAAFVVPGLPTHITPDAVVGMMPKFQESTYQISDPLNPPETLPQATKRINQSEERVKGLERELQKALSKTTFLEDVEARSLHLTEELNKVRAALQLALGEHQKASELNQYLQQTLTTLETDLEASKGRVEELQAECQEWELQFSDRVSVEASARFQLAKKNEIERIFQEHDAITSQAMALFRQLQRWGEKVAHGHAAKREIIKNLAASYNANLEELGESVEKERGHYLQQIELLHEKIGRLQHELAGDLVEPVYGQFGFDQNGRIANALAEWLWNHHKIPLKVTGFEVSPDGTLTTGFTYPRSLPVEALTKQIEGDSSTIARSLGLYALEKPQKLQIADVFTVRVRRERPARKADKGSLYRSSQEFVKYILSQPVRLRIVGEPGAAKLPVGRAARSHPQPWLSRSEYAQRSQVALLRCRICNPLSRYQR